MSEHALFRRQALAKVERPGAGGDVLRISPSWTRWAYWVVLGAVFTGVAYLGIARSTEWAQGQSLVHVSGVDEITAKHSGTLANIAVRTGQRVKEGQLLATLSDRDERAQLKRLEQEFNLQLARTLRDPADQAARQNLVTLRVERDLAQSRLADLRLRAPRDGLVEDIRVREGQAVSPGDHLLTLSGDGGGCAVWALVPARYRPELRPGAEFRFNVYGYRYAQVTTEIRSVSAQAIGPREVRRYLGNDIGDAVQIEGPAVIAEAVLPSCSFESDGQTFRFHRGMSGTSEIQLREQPLWALFFPELRKVFR